MDSLLQAGYGGRAPAPENATQVCSTDKGSWSKLKTLVVVLIRILNDACSRWREFQIVPFWTPDNQTKIFLDSRYKYEVFFILDIRDRSKLLVLLPPTDMSKLRQVLGNLGTGTNSTNDGPQFIADELITYMCQSFRSLETVYVYGHSLGASVAALVNNGLKTGRNSLDICFSGEARVFMFLLAPPRVMRKPDSWMAWGFSFVRTQIPVAIEERDWTNVTSICLEQDPVSNPPNSLSLYDKLIGICMLSDPEFGGIDGHGARAISDALSKLPPWKVASIIQDPAAFQGMFDIIRKIV